MTFLTKLGVTTIAAGAITLGAMTYWNGGTAIDSAIQKIEEQASKITIFSQNEDKLVGQIEKLVAERNDLVNQLSDKNLKEQKIIELQTELSNKNSEISELQGKLENADANGEELAERIDALTVELQKANTDAERLQAALDENKSEESPMTEEEINALVGVEEAPEMSYKFGDQTYEPIKGIKISSETGGIRVTNNTGKEITLSGVPGEAERVMYTGNYRVLNKSINYVLIEMNGTEYKINITQ